MQSGKIVRSYLKKHWLRYFTGIGIVFVSSYLNTLIPRYLGIVVDRLSSPLYTADDVVRTTYILALISVLSFLSRFTWRYLILGFCRQIEFFLRERLFSHLQCLSADYYVKNNTGDIITRTIVDVQAVRMMLGFATVAMIDAIVTLTMSIINMSLSINFLFTLLAFLPVPFLIYLITKVRLLVRKRYSRVQESISNISSKVQENITGIRVMKAFSQEEKETEVFRRLSEKKLQSEVKLAKAFALINPSVTLTFGIVFSVFLVVGGSMVAQNTVSLGDFVAFNSYLLLIMGPINHVGKIVERWQRGVTSMKRIDKILMEKPSVDDSHADSCIKNIADGSVRVDNLSFTYENTSIEVLKNIRFFVPSGGTLAIMGSTGCGKSTLIGALIRLWPCEHNTIYIGGTEIHSIPLKVLRNHFAYVPQESFLFSDTIKENIRFYNPAITDEQVVEAAKAAYVHENVLEFPHGYDTVVGERGMTLSGGQKQRIALARALAANPKILLLDDCLSAVDAETEKNIIENLRVRICGCTAILVTHRLSAAALADNILVLNECGEIAEIGSHTQLINLGGSYAALVDIMNAGTALEGEEGADVEE